MFKKGGGNPYFGYDLHLWGSFLPLRSTGQKEIVKCQFHFLSTFLSFSIVFLFPEFFGGFFQKRNLKATVVGKVQ